MKICLECKIVMIRLDMMPAEDSSRLTMSIGSTSKVALNKIKNKADHLD
jgi:hypothetical protein